MLVYRKWSIKRRYSNKRLLGISAAALIWVLVRKLPTIQAERRVQKLENAGVSWDKIIDISGHRNVLSLNSYEGDDKNQAKELSKLISWCK